MTLHPCFQPAFPLLPIPTPLRLFININIIINIDQTPYLDKATAVVAGAVLVILSLTSVCGDWVLISVSVMLQWCIYMMTWVIIYIYMMICCDEDYLPILPKQLRKLHLLFFSFQLCLGWFTGVAKAHVTGMLFILNQEAEIQSG